MRTIVFELLNKKFDDQYTFDLQGYPYENNQPRHQKYTAPSTFLSLDEITLGGMGGQCLSLLRTVQFDDRYDQRYSKEFVSVPLYPGRAVLAENEKSDDISTPFLSDQDEKV
ncbi:hypothetical protein [Absidia glauca]|uniref:Uncharacterized protein n=1 Tax=Absidia glauca TaxID=4829 RepID=A0A168S3S8_ABSGL|nr:hypothetical protein [Absidia glauca]